MNMSANDLTTGAISLLSGGANNLRPIVQVTDLAPAQNKDDPALGKVGLPQGEGASHLLMISDSMSCIPAWLASKFNVLVTTGRIRKGSVVQVLQYTFGTYNDRRFIIITDLHPITWREQLGEPERLPFLFTAEPHPNLLPDNFLDDQIQISELENAASTAKWVIKGRVTAKSSLHSYRTNKGDMHAFYFDLHDRWGLQIRVKCINSLGGCNYGYYEDVELGKLYYVSKGDLFPLTRKCKPFHSNMEIILKGTSMLVKCDEADALIPEHHLTFTLMKDIENMEVGSYLDVAGVPFSVGDPKCVKCSDGLDFVKRKLVIPDRTGYAQITLCGPSACYGFAETLKSRIKNENRTLVAVKSARLISSSEKLLETVPFSQLWEEPVSRAVYDSYIPATSQEI